MVNEDAWQVLTEEFRQIDRSKDFEPFQPLLDFARPAINHATMSNDVEVRSAVEALLHEIKKIQADHKAGRDVEPRISEIAGGYLQNDWTVDGDVRQAGRDYNDNSKKYVKQTFNLFVDNGGVQKLRASKQRISVPIILVAMTREQAEQLASKEAFKDAQFHVLQDAFDELNQHLNNELGDWLKRYGKSPMDWKPCIIKSEDASIEQIIKDAFQGPEIEYLLKSKGITRPLVPDFIDVLTLADIEKRSCLRSLREKGCIVIVDVISLRHPMLQRAFHLSLLDAFPKTSIVCLPPSERIYDAASRLAIVIQLKIEELEFHRRKKDVIGDSSQSRMITRGDELPSWLFDRLFKLDHLLPEKTGAPGFKE
jgi:hypothetical protein